MTLLLHSQLICYDFVNFFQFFIVGVPVLEVAKQDHHQRTTKIPVEQQIAQVRSQQGTTARKRQIQLTHAEGPVKQPTYLRDELRLSSPNWIIIKENEKLLTVKRITSLNAFTTKKLILDSMSSGWELKVPRGGVCG
ncbi:Hypothetical_protein [Hexamita inflata]|uniref:Hypothetical_protein n=1 Tax=Hexamita inflata TaxID=28002 RepID=A0AA86PFQ7_9EUKA|nr:Hypothetical protein HINF_LOCUS26014 [Hexamita inflata]